MTASIQGHAGGQTLDKVRSPWADGCTGRWLHYNGRSNHESGRTVAGLAFLYWGGVHFPQFLLFAVGWKGHTHREEVITVLCTYVFVYMLASVKRWEWSGAQCKQSKKSY